MTLTGRWTRENRTVLEALIRRNYLRPPIAVFDWDNTCIRGDIADVVFHQLCAELAFKFEAPGFWDWITEAQCDDAVTTAYREFRTSPNEENRLKLRMRMELTRRALHEGEDDTAAWAWDTGAFIGWTEEEVRDYTGKVIERALRHPSYAETIEVDGNRVEIKLGLELRPEMEELVRMLLQARWQVWVLSASPQWEVEAFANSYGLSAECVIGMRREIVGGKICPEVAPPVSYSDGKLDAYRTLISRGEAPSLVAGDSLGDWKILESSADVRLLVEPAPAPLRDFAFWRKSEGEVWLLQEFA